MKNILTILFGMSSLALLAQTPVASFTTNPAASGGNVSVCSGSTVTYTNTSTQTVVGSTYTWSFGTGANPSTATGIGPHVVTYTGASSYSTTATLTVNNNNGQPTSPANVNIVVTSLNTPLLALTSSGSGFGFSNSNGTIIFRNCQSTGLTEYAFQSNYGSGTTQTFNWGDGTTSNQTNMVGPSISHFFPVGQFTITHTVTVGGCQNTNTYIVFNGALPQLTVSGAGQNTCLPSPYSFDIVSNNVPIDYIVSFSDNSPAIIFNTANDTTISHIFNTSSCGFQIIGSPNNPPIDNSFSSTIYAENACGSTIFIVGPIFISTGPDAEFSYTPSSPVCQNEEVTFTNQTLGGENVGNSGCDSVYTFLWDFSLASNFTVNSGTLGSDNGFTGIFYDYTEWTSGSEQLDVTFNTPGTYEIWMYAANSCGIDSVMHEITINPTATVIIDPSTQTICSGNQTATITMTSTVPGYTINWEVTNNQNVNGFNPQSGSGVSPVTLNPMTLTNNSNQLGTITISATVGCSSVPPTTAVINVTQQANVIANPNEELICSNETTDIDLSSNVVGTTFSWTASAPATIGGESNGSGTTIAQTLTNSGTTIDTVTYTVTPGGSVCPGPPITVEVAVQPQITINSNSDIAVCPGAPISPSAYTSNPAGATISWTNSNTSIGLGASGNGNISSWVAPPNNTGSAVTGTITVSAQLNNCPGVQDQFTVTIQPNPVFDYNINPSSGLDCITNTATIIGSVSPAGCNVAWVGPSIVSGGNTPSPIVNAPGTYTITMTDPVSGCSSNSSLTLDPPILLNITGATVTNIPCYNGSNGAISIQTDNGGANLQYSWTPSLNNSGNVSNLTSGTYSVTVTNPDGCADDTTVTITDGEPIFVELMDSVGSECGEANGSLTINATGGAGGFTYFWTIGQSSPTLSNVDAGTYDVVVTDAAGCALVLPFELGCTSLEPIVANQFISPNSDGKNDVWTILNLELYPENTVTIYNRWGNVVYEASPYKNDWNGTLRGNASQPLPAATYFYVIDTDKKSQEPFTGYLEIQP